MNADPLIAHETQPTQTVAELVRADERLSSEFSQITLPVLILHGTADKAAKPGGSQVFFDAAGSTDKTLKLYEGHVHDLLNDLEKETVMADIKRWISGRLPSGGDRGDAVTANGAGPGSRITAARLGGRSIRCWAYCRVRHMPGNRRHHPPT